MPKYSHISNIPAKIFFDILETKNYQLLKPKPKEQGLEQIFISIYDDFFDKSNNPEAKEYLVLVRKEAFLVYKIAVIKQALLFYWSNPITEEMRIDGINALNEGCDLNIDVNANFDDEVKRILSENVGWLENDLQFLQSDLNQLKTNDKGKKVTFYDRLISLSSSAPQNFVINDKMTLLEYVEVESAIMKHIEQVKIANKKK